MMHRVVLSNRQVLLLIECNNKLTLATENPVIENDIEMYILSISDVITVYPNSGSDAAILTNGLKGG